MVDVHLDNPSRGPRWLVPVATTMGAWLVAFLVVTALLTAFADELASLPLALRALLISGVLVALMVNLVMPLLSGALARWLAGPPPTTAGATAQDQVRRREPFLSPRSYPELDASSERPTRTNLSVRTPRR
jgi:antibiotic biosynthesis monooxygenase (ABM) superfamily enzyme